MVLNDVGLKVFYVDEREIDNYTVRNFKLLDVEVMKKFNEAPMFCNSFFDRVEMKGTFFNFIIRLGRILGFPNPPLPF